MTSPIAELYGVAPLSRSAGEWSAALKAQVCPYLGKKCIKVRKSAPAVSIGTCTVLHGSRRRAVVICPFRFLERRCVFTDALHLLTVHEPGNELHIVPEVTLPGGSVDYFLVSVRRGKVRDCAGVEIQTLDTTGTVWPARQRLLQSMSLSVQKKDVASTKPFGMNWKMTAKTILVQMHHKVETFEHMGKHIVLAVQDSLMEYMRSEFSFENIRNVRSGDVLHFHVYSLERGGTGLTLRLTDRVSTDSDGLASALGLRAETRVEQAALYSQLEEKISSHTLWTPA